MAQFKAFDSNVEVSGNAVLSVVEWLGTFQETAINILAENDILLGGLFHMLGFDFSLLVEHRQYPKSGRAEYS